MKNFLMRLGIVVGLLFPNFVFFSNSNIDVLHSKINPVPKDALKFDYLVTRNDDYFTFHTEWRKATVENPKLSDFSTNVYQNGLPIYEGIGTTELIKANDPAFEDIMVSNIYFNADSGKNALDMTFLNENVKSGFNFSNALTYKIQLSDSIVWTYSIPQMDIVEDISLQTDISQKDNDTFDATLNWSFTVNDTTEGTKVNIEKLSIIGAGIEGNSNESIVSLPVKESPGSFTFHNNLREQIKNKWIFRVELKPEDAGPEDIWKYDYAIDFNFLDVNVTTAKKDILINVQDPNNQIKQITINHPGFLNNGSETDTYKYNQLKNTDNEILIKYTDVGLGKTFDNWTYSIESIDINWVNKVYRDAFSTITTEAFPVGQAIGLSIGIFIIILILFLFLLWLLIRKRKLNRVSAVDDGYYDQYTDIDYLDQEEGYEDFY